MKKIISTFCLTFLILNSFSQDYHRLIKVGKDWDVWSENTLNVFLDGAARIYFTGNDTLIDGHVYQVSRQYPYRPVNPGFLVPPFYIDTTSYPTGQFIREDTLLKKVYIYANELTPHDQLLYDFHCLSGILFILITRPTLTEPISL